MIHIPKAQIHSLNLLILIAVLLSSASAHAQSNLLKGYIINNNNDTILGYLKYDTDKKLSTGVLFYSEKKKNNFKIYHANQIKGFVFSNKRSFKSFVLPGDKTPVFAKKNITGKVNLYTQKVETYGNTILYNPEKNLTEFLSPKTKYVFVIDSNAYVYSPAKYIGKIKRITGDDKTVEKDIDSLKSNANDLKQYIVSYNKRFEDAYPLYVYEDSIRFSHDFLIGMPVANRNGRKVRLSASLAKQMTDMNHSFFYRAGINYLYFWNPRKERDTSLYYQPVTMHYFNFMPIGLLISANTEKVIPYGYLSFGLAFLFEEYYSGEQTTIRKNFYYCPAVNFGAGVKIKIAKTKYLTIEISPPILLAESYNLFVNIGLSY